MWHVLYKEYQEIYTSMCRVHFHAQYEQEIPLLLQCICREKKLVHKSLELEKRAGLLF